ncbi:MAG: S1C family serine protease [Alphaproteobacteria bacterium]|uniref:S1C family serine protease n=1 Tax=Candidatus Nitrobium versatile TaxID=2884831 RepID=A0A953M0N5_9BACT|nr:S1C family serine protease [Candidatus Nitrobium versatile]
MRRKTVVKYFVVMASIFIAISAALANISEIVLKKKKAVVTIYVYDKNMKEASSGSGFTVDPSGIVVTNYHVVSEWKKERGNNLFIKMENGGYFVAEKLIAFDEENDFAIIKIDARELPVLNLAPNYKPQQGERIVVIGSPLGLETTVSDGIISSVRGELIQITAPISTGNSGSPVFNSQGDVIGIATFLIKGGQNLNFAIPVKLVSKMLDDYKKGKIASTAGKDFSPTPPPSLSHKPNPTANNRWKPLAKRNDGTCLTALDTESISFQTVNVFRYQVMELAIDESAFVEEKYIAPNSSSRWKCYNVDYILMVLSLVQKGGAHFIDVPSPDSLRYINHLGEIDCSKDTTRLLDIHYYIDDSNDSPVKLSSFDQSFQWHAIQNKSYQDSSVRQILGLLAANPALERSL